jgi:copper homeostasis protein
MARKSLKLKAGLPAKDLLLNTPLEMDAFTLEIACFNIAGALTAYKAGADRIEFCENPEEGGTTPSFGALQLVKKLISIPVFPIIRPRGGDFFYRNEEFSIMQQDVLFCKSLGFEGIVFGLLNTDGTIDKERTASLTSLAYPMDVTFHRAFDRCYNPLKSLEDIIECGCQRILTSGQFTTASEGAGLIKQLIAVADDRIVIMPGSGVRSNNIIELATATNAIEFHSSGRRPIKTSMLYEVPTMMESLTYIGVDKEEVKSMQAALTKHFSESALS